MTTVRVDTHVHSRFSDTLKLSFLSRAGARECYAEPEDVYQLALERGMDLVTISDHDTIDGVLEIAHHGDHVFLSEEISAVFPDNGCVMHVLAWDISEAQHDDIQRVRFNIYELVDYLRSQGICHSLAHPLSTVNGRLRRDHVEQCLLMFPVLELMNSSRDPYHWTALEAITEQIQPSDIERWANQYDLEPAVADGWSFTGGSDDHSGIAVARGYTEFDGAATVAEFRDAVAAARTRPAGQNMTAVSFSHNVYAVTTQYFVESHRKRGADSIYDALFRVIASGGADLSPLGPIEQLAASPAGRVLMGLQAEMTEGEGLPTVAELIAGGADEAMHRRVNAIAHRVLNRVWGSYADSAAAAVTEMELDSMARWVGDVLQTMLLVVPYGLGFRHVYNDRQRARSLHEAIGVGFEPDPRPGVAIFVDTLEGVHGVSIGLRRMVRELTRQGRRVHLVGLAVDTETGSAPGLDDLADLGDDRLVVFESVRSFGIPGYEAEGLDPGHGQRLGLPPVLEMMQWCVDQRIELIQVSTPGPVGLAGLAIARFLNLPVVGHYHTDVPRYAATLVGEPSLVAVCKALVGWFYASLDRVIVPSMATRETVMELGVAADKVQVLPRGVDADRFTPRRKEAEFWRSFGLDSGLKVLYVGRFSGEKNLGVLLDAFERLRQEGVHAELVMVGDGPDWRSVADRAAQDASIALPGCLHGETLEACYANADVFAFPSATDSFGAAVLEAQAAGLPAIVTDAGGPAEIVEHDRTGIVVAADDVDAFVGALRRLAATDVRRPMGEAARTRAVRHTHADAAAELWNLFGDVLGERRRSWQRQVRVGV